MSIRSKLLRTSALLLLAASAALPIAYAADPAPPPAQGGAAALGENAALRYWPAFHFLPKTDADQDKVLDAWRTTAANDPAATKLTAAASQSLRYLHDGARLREVDWGLDYSQGFGLLLPQAQAGRTLTRLACFRAHQRALGGDAAGAVHDLADAMALGRHLADDGILVTILVRYAIENVAIETAGEDLLRLKGPELDRLLARIEQLPPSASVKDSVRVEREFGQKWAAKEIRSWAGKPDVSKRLTALFGPGDANVPSVTEQALKAGGGTAEGVAAQIEALGPVYDELEAALALPREQAHKRVDEVRERAGANSFAGLLLPAYGRVIDVEARATTRMALLKAAIAIVQGGPDKLKDFKDPFGTGPFEHKPAAVGGGFELRSKLVVKEEPVTLRVGMPVEPKKQP